MFDADAYVFYIELQIRKLDKPRRMAHLLFILPLAKKNLMFLCTNSIAFFVFQAMLVLVFKAKVL